MNPRKEKQESSMTGMRITHCWEIDPAKSAEFAAMYGCEAVRNFDDMLGKVDGVISGGYFEHPWNHLLHQPYLEAGLPNLINRPFSNSIVKARKMIDTARKHGATILCPSAYEYTEASAQARAWVAGRKIVCYNATNSFDEYPTHGIHGMYMIHRAIVETGNPIVSVSYRARNWYSPPGVMTFEHAGKSGNSFLGSLHQIVGSWGSLQIHTPEEINGKPFEIVGGTGFPFNVTEAWAPTIWAYQRMAMYKDMPQSFDAILEKTRVYLAGWTSVLNGGKVVRPEDVAEDWEAPVELPSRPGDPYPGMFRKLFG
jgi:predicted dehydrogenase